MMSEDEPKVAALQNEVEEWRRLARRLLTHNPIPGSLNTEPYLGTLPDRLPYDLPLPPDARIVGSVSDERNATIYLDTGRSPDEVLQFYRGRMQAPEWDVIEPHMPAQSGFVPTMYDPGLLFCQGPKGPSLRVYARYGGTGTDVMLEVGNDPRWSPCQGEQIYMKDPGVPAPHHNWPQDPLPALRAPARATMHPATGGGGGGGDGRYYQYSQADLDTTLDLGAVADHFTGELEKAGWTRRDSGQEGRAAWSIWTLPPKDGKMPSGLFIALRTDEGASQHYFLYLRTGSA
jgi:hypothetical protein